MALVLLAVMWLYPRATYEDRVVPIGDTLDYQIIAVNLARLNIFPSDAILLPDSAYHFDTRLAADAERINERKQHTGPGYNFVRNPLYTLFCGAVYKVSGVHISWLYSIQFLILIIALSLLPVAGAAVADQRGVWVGSLAALVIFLLSRSFATEVQTQALVLPYTIGLWWLLSVNLRSTDVFSIVVMGIYLGIGLLLKNFFIPVAFLATAYYLYRHQRLRSLFLVAAILITIAPWTIYANRLTGPSDRFFWLTTQGEDVLLASNNDAATDGDWHPEGVTLTAQYQQLSGTGEPIALQVFTYCVSHPAHSIAMLSEKVHLGLLTRWPPVLFILLLWTCAFLVALAHRMRPAIAVLVALIAAVALACYLMHRGTFYAFQQRADHLLRITGLPLLLLVSSVPLSIWLSRHALLRLSPATCIVLVSFILLNMIFYGSPRIVGMIDFLWMFYAGMLMYSIGDLLAE